MNTCEKEYRRWLASDVLSAQERARLLAIENDPDTMELLFSEEMAFGTAGLRAQMELGTACMNRFTVAHATRGIAALVNAAGGAQRGVVIAYDCRNHSEEFARVSACVLAGAGIRVFLFDALRPTPQLSFAVRHLHTVAGINITASHNPKEYNGYKAYWEDGAQISPEQARVVCEARAHFDVLDMSAVADYQEAVQSGKITILTQSSDEEYIDAVLKSAVCPDTVRALADTFSVVYTPLHGAGYRLVPEVLRRIGLKHLYTVEEQMIPDGNFPTVVKPNPEYAAVFSLGIALADRCGSDLIIATDPDSDRVGVMVRGSDGRFITVSGNQMGALLMDYIIRRREQTGTMPASPYCVKSIVSTDMARAIADAHGVKLYDVLTGFKFIGEVIKKHEEQGNTDGFLLGFEESYGYLAGSYARDKDAVEASMLIVEMAAYYKQQNMTLSDALNGLYRIYGLYREDMTDIYMEGLHGVEQRRALMGHLRARPPKMLGGSPVVQIGDYLAGTLTDTNSGVSHPTGVETSDVLIYSTAGGDRVIVRPSGTEPKVKIYTLAHGEKGESADNLEAKITRCKSDIMNAAGIKTEG